MFRGTYQQRLGAIGGNFSLRGEVASGLNVTPVQGATNSKVYVEGTVAMAIAPAPVNPPTMVVINPRTALDAGFLLSHARTDGTNCLVAMGNMTAGALDPADEVCDGLALYQLPLDPTGVPWLRKGLSGRCLGSTFNFTLDHGNIVAITTLEAAAAVFTASPRRYIPLVNDVVILSPRNALPAGIALSHVRVSNTGELTIGLANPTAGAIDPAGISWDAFCIHNPRLSTGQGICRYVAGRGAPLCRPFRTTLNHGNIGALDHLEATLDLTTIGMRGISPGMPVLVCPTAALPAGIGLSYGRISAGNTLAIDLVNITAGAIDPAAQTYDVAIFEDLPA